MRAAKKFEAIAGSVRQGSQWRAAVQFPVEKIAAEARTADLVISSHHDRDHGSSHTAAVPGALIIQMGRPVLVVPADADQLAVTKLVVAWKDAREARRVLSDAQPFLKQAQRVLFVEMSDNTESAPAARHRLSDVNHHLCRHGVDTDVMVVAEAKPGSAVDQLLAIAEQQNADVIVAIGYGHGRRKEWAFGGFPRSLLAQTLARRAFQSLTRSDGADLSSAHRLNLKATMYRQLARTIRVENRSI